MPIDPKNMEAWLAEGEDEEMPELPVDGGDEAPEEEAEPEEEAAAEGDLEERFPTLFPLLEDNGDVFEEAGDTLDQDALLSEDGEFVDDELALLIDAVLSLPDDLIEALKAETVDLSWDDATEIAEALSAGEHISDPDRVAGLLFHVSKHLDEIADIGAEDEDLEEEYPEDEAELDMDAEPELEEAVEE